MSTLAYKIPTKNYSKVFYEMHVRSRFFNVWVRVSSLKDKRPIVPKMGSATN